ncbi:MAG TPA: GtrA family protein [Marinagarivorans sp.]
MAFLCVGGSATLVQLVLLAVFIEFVGLAKVLASATAYLLSAGYNYMLNYYVTFGSRESHWVTLPKFVLVVAVGVLINTSVFAACLPYLPYLIAQVIAIGAALVANYLLHKFWIYRRVE